jgi:hypothetical protein
LDEIRLIEAAHHMGEMYALKLFLLYLTLPLPFFECPYIPDGSTDYSLNGVNDAMCANDVPFEGGVDVNLRLGVETPKPQFYPRISNQINIL